MRSALNLPNVSTPFIYRLLESGFHRMRRSRAQLFHSNWTRNRTRTRFLGRPTTKTSTSCGGLLKMTSIPVSRFQCTKCSLFWINFHAPWKMARFQQFLYILTVKCVDSTTYTMRWTFLTYRSDRPLTPFIWFGSRWSTVYQKLPIPRFNSVHLGDNYRNLIQIMIIW